MRPVGVLGGMGPAATVLFQQRVLAAVPAADDADHVPLLIDMNPQVPSRIAHILEGTGDDPGPVLAAMARRLERAGAAALAMPCNTAHHYAGAIRAASGVPLLDMVAMSVARAHEVAASGAPIGVLGSPALRRTGVFGPALERAGRAPVWPADEDALLAAIRDVKAGRDPAAARAALAAAARGLASDGAGAVLVACTEFSLHADAARGPAPLIDTLDVLAEATAAFAQGARADDDPARRAAE